MSDANESQNTETEAVIEASGDSIVLAQGLHAIADGLLAIARALSPPEEEEISSEPDRFLDGSPMTKGRDPNKLFPLPDRKSTRLNSSHIQKSRMPSSA